MTMMKVASGFLISDAGFEVFRPVKIQIKVYWVVTSCRFVVGGPCCFHLIEKTAT
jgi:hypothetical protein